MAEDEMYLGNLEAWVCEEKKTISYTWLSNELSVPSNVAKQMLHAFAEKKGSEVQPIYLLSGNREGYGHTITLVAKSKLAETKKQFKPVFSVHVYSVQAVLPKDSAHLWSVDNEQRKALFTQPDNSITTNRWSAIDFPAGTEKRSAPPPAAAPQQAAPVVKKEAVKVKVQPKEETNDESSQPSSPEKTAKPATGGRLTTAKPAAGGKKGASSPTKKQPGGAREMTSFFKKAPEEEKTQTLIANAKAGKPAKGTSSPSKPRVMEGFFAKKEKMDEDHAAEEGEEEEDKEEDEEKNEARRKVKLEKVQPAETDELDELLGGEEEAEEAKPPPAPAKQKRKRAAAAKDDDDDMELESSKAKADTTKRQRLRKGKRKRSDDNDDNDANGNDEGEGEAANGRPARTIKQEKEAKRDEDDGAEDEESTAMATKKKATKRRRVVQKEPEDEEEADQEEAQPQKKKRAAKAAPAKKGRKEAAAEQQEEEDGEKENEEQDHNVVKQEKTKKKAAAAAKPVAVERKEGVAKPTEYVPGQRRKKKVRRERTYTDDKGFEVTEDVWEEVSDDDTPAPVALLSVKEEAIKNAEATASTARKKSTTQGNIMNFFGKK